MVPTLNTLTDDMPDELEARPIPGYGGDYLITRDGVVWSLKRARPRQLAVHRGQVKLHANGKTCSRSVEALLEEVFGEDTPDDEATLEYVQERYGDHPDVARWMSQLEQADER